MTGTAGGASTEEARPPRDDVRAALLEAALDCFTEQGYRPVTMEQVARRAGFSKGAVYSNFEGKTDLFLSVLVEVATLRAAVVLEEVARLPLPGADEAPGQSEVWIAAAAQVFVQQATAPVLGLLVAEFAAEARHDADLAARTAAAHQEVTERVVPMLHQVARAMGLRFVRPAAEVAVLLTGLYDGLALESVGAPGPVVSPRTIELVLRTLVEPVEPVERAGPQLDQPDQPGQPGQPV